MRQDAAGNRERLFEGRVTEQLNPAEAALEDLMLGMRMCAGVSHDAVRKAAPLISGLVDTFEELVALGLATSTEGRFRPTTRGWLLGNELYGRIWGLARHENDSQTA
jgi:oxygen-independent coproporphyrinogen-3 oxidase